MKKVEIGNECKYVYSYDDEIISCDTKFDSLEECIKTAEEAYEKCDEDTLGFDNDTEWCYESIIISIVEDFDHNYHSNFLCDIIVDSIDDGEDYNSCDASEYINEVLYDFCPNAGWECETDKKDDLNLDRSIQEYKDNHIKENLLNACLIYVKYGVGDKYIGHPLKGFYNLKEHKWL